MWCCVCACLSLFVGLSGDCLSACLFYVMSCHVIYIYIYIYCSYVFSKAWEDDAPKRPLCGFDRKLRWGAGPSASTAARPRRGRRPSWGTRRAAFIGWGRTGTTPQTLRDLLHSNHLADVTVPQRGIPGSNKAHRCLPTWLFSGPSQHLVLLVQGRHDLRTRWSLCVWACLVCL